MLSQLPYCSFFHTILSQAHIYLKIQDLSPKEYDCTEEAILYINCTVHRVVQILLYSLVHLRSSFFYKLKIFKKAATY